MKSMRVALAALAMVILAGIGFALLNSTSKAPKVVASAPVAKLPTPPPSLAPKVRPIIPKQTMPPSPVRMDQELPILAAPKVQAPGIDVAKEEGMAKEMESKIAALMKENKFSEANKIRRDLIRTRARLGDMASAAPMYVEIGRSELMAGNAQAAQDAAQSANVMASIGRKDPSVMDDVAILQASAALYRGDLPKADYQLQQARKYRNESGGPENPSVGAELTALEGLLDDMQGNHESAEKAFVESLDRLVIGGTSPEGAPVLARSRWIFERAVKTREEQLGANAPETQAAKDRLARLQ